MPKPLEIRLEASASRVGLLPPAVAEIAPSKFPPWNKPNLEICTIRDSRRNSSDAQLRASFLDHASEHDDSYHIYTDGSKGSIGVGCSVVTSDSIIKKRLPSNCSIFTAELLAILTALKFIFYSNSSNKIFTIFSDSLSVLSSLRNLVSCHHLVQEIQDWFYLLVNRRGFIVKFCWAPSHVGIVGNERADVEAKAATRLSHISNMGVPVSDFKNTIRFYCRDQWQAYWSTLSSNFKLKSIRPSVLPWAYSRLDRRSDIVLSRLRIGHTKYTHGYLVMSGVGRQVPRCSTCHVDLTVVHILVQCPNFENERRACSLANKTLAAILGEHAQSEQIMKFLKDINIFYEL